MKFFQPDITEQSPVDPIPAGATGPASPIRTSSSTTSSSKPVTPTTAREFPGRSEASNAERDEAEVALEATEEHKNKPENDRESSTKTPGPASSPLPVPTVDGAAVGGT